MSRRLRRISLSAAFALTLAWTPLAQADGHDSAPGNAWRILWSWLSPFVRVQEPVAPSLDSKVLEDGAILNPNGFGAAPASAPISGEISEGGAGHDPYG